MSKFVFAIALCLVTAAPAKARAATKDLELAGVLAFRSPHRPHLTPERASWLVAEARAALKDVPEAQFVPLHILLAIGLEETDLQWWRVRDGNQCGVAQFYVDGLHLSYVRRRALCRSMARSPKLSFTYALKELAHLRQRYCKTGSGTALWRCLLSVYNMGPRWLRGGMCLTGTEKVRRFCEARQRYWLRVACFATGLRLARKPRWSCRSAWTDRHVVRWYSLPRFPLAELWERGLSVPLRRPGATDGRVVARVVGEVAPLAQRREVLLPAILGHVVQVRDGKHDQDGLDPVLGERRLRHAPMSVVPQGVRGFIIW